MFNEYEDIDWGTRWVYENSPEEGVELVSFLSEELLDPSVEAVSFDFETTKMAGDDDEEVNGLKDEMYSVSFCFDNEAAYSLRINEKTMDPLANLFNMMMDRKDLHKIIQNFRFDSKLTYRLTNRMPVVGDHSWEDTLVQAYLLDENRSVGLKKIASRYLGVDGFKYENRLNEMGKISKIKEIDWFIASHYNCADSWMTYKLWPLFNRMLEEQDILTLYENLYKDLNIVLLETEVTGFRIDRKYLQDMTDKIWKEILDIRERLNKIAGFEFNLRSVPQVRKVLEKLDLARYVTKIVKTGISTDKDVLKELKPKDKSGFIDFMVSHREKATEKDYVDGILKRLDEYDICRSNFLPHGTRPGRLSSRNPNFQNLKKGRYGIRYAFIARPGYKLVIADFNQMELRILAWDSKDKVMLGIFERKGNIHSATAIVCFKLKCKEKGVKKEHPSEYGKGKTINFALIYGKTVYTLAKDLDCTEQEAEQLIGEILGSYKDVKYFKAEIYADACEYEYITNYFGKRRRFPGLRELRKKYSISDKKVAAMLREAFNARIQGPAGIMTNIAIIKTKKRCVKDDIDAKLLAQVHDEMVWEVRDDQVVDFIPAMKEESEEIIEGLHIPLEEKVVDRWGECYPEKLAA